MNIRIDLIKSLAFATVLLSGSALAGDNGVSSSSPVGGGPGNSWAAHGGFVHPVTGVEGGDPNCIGDRVSNEAQEQQGIAIGVEGGTDPHDVTDILSGVVTIAGVAGLYPAHQNSDGDCAAIF